MQVVILAAGDGSRMKHPDGPPKLLLKIHGQTLLEYHLSALSTLGATDFVVVAGYRAEAVEQFIAGNGLARRFKLCVIRNDRWCEGSATSILAARPHVTRERFAVVMGDHLYDPEGLRGFLNVRGDFVGVFDSAPRYVEFGEATKATSHRGHVLALGKNLADFKYVDTGMFLCSRRIFSVAEECLAAGRGTFNEVKRHWIAQDTLHVFDCRGAFWLDVDTPEDLERARGLIGRQLGRPRDGLVARLVNRRLSLPLSHWLVRRTRITPNQVSIASFVLTLFPAALFCLGPGLPSAVAGLLTQLASVLDGCDGEVARLRRMSTAYGAWLDAVLDRLGDALLVGGLAYGAWRVSASPWVGLVGFLALTGSFAVSYTEARYEGAFKRSPRFGGGLPAKRDARLLLIMLGGLAGQLAGTLALIASLTLIEVLRRLRVARGALV